MEKKKTEQAYAEVEVTIRPSQVIGEVLHSWNPNGDTGKPWSSGNKPSVLSFHSCPSWPSAASYGDLTLMV